MGGEIGAHLARRPEGPGEQGSLGSGGGVKEERAALVAEARQRVKGRIHGKAVALTGGRLVGSFPEVFGAWAGGGPRGGGDGAILELAARHDPLDSHVFVSIELTGFDGRIPAD